MSTLFARGKAMLSRVLPTVWIDETGTLSYRAAGDTFAGAVAGIHAKRGLLDKRDARVAAGLIPVGTTVFLLVASQVVTAPRVRDRWTDQNGIVYAIDFAQSIAFNSAAGGLFWRLEVTQEL